LIAYLSVKDTCLLIFKNNYMTVKQTYNLLKDVSEGYVTPERALTQLCKDDIETKPKMGNIETCFEEEAMNHMFNELNDFEQGI
jgi:hypothetical protein